MFTCCVGKTLSQARPVCRTRMKHTHMLMLVRMHVLSQAALLKDVRDPSVEALDFMHHFCASAHKHVDRIEREISEFMQRRRMVRGP